MKNKILKIKLNWETHDTYILFDSKEKGTVSISNYDDETWIHGLYVIESARNKGLATALLNEAEKYSKCKCIKVSTANHAEQWLKDFYVKRGYLIDNTVQ